MFNIGDRVVKTDFNFCDSHDIPTGHTGTISIINKDMSQPYRVIWDNPNNEVKPYFFKSGWWMHSNCIQSLDPEQQKIHKQKVIIDKIKYLNKRHEEHVKSRAISAKVGNTEQRKFTESSNATHLENMRAAEHLNSDSIVTIAEQLSRAINRTTVEWPDRSSRGAL